MSNITSWHDRYVSLRKSAAAKVEQAKKGAVVVVDTLVSAAAAGSAGLLDEAKGTTAGASGIRQHTIGPVPTSAAAGIVAKGIGLALEMGGEQVGKQVGALGTGFLDAAAYVGVRNLWAKHQQSA